jgi:tetratricopeptide (TPR) repeat protein
VAFFETKKYKEATVDFEEAIRASGDRTLRALALLGAGDSYYALQDWDRAHNCYHAVEHQYRDIAAVSQEEVMFKLGVVNRTRGFTRTADEWFDKVNEYYPNGKYGAEARRRHSNLSNCYYGIEVASYQDEPRARECASDLKARGFQNVVIQHESRFATLFYCVVIGKYINRLEAERAKSLEPMPGKYAAVTTVARAKPQD